MGIRYDGKMLIKIPTTMKEQAEKKAEKKGLTLSSYIRDLIIKDLKRV